VSAASRIQKGLDKAAEAETPEQALEGIYQVTGIERVSSPALLNAPPMDTTSLADVIPRAVSWLWDKRIPLGKLTTFDGDPGVGKSTILADLSARVSRGLPMPDESPGIQGAVIILNAEDDPDDTIRPRLEAAGADLDQTFVIDIKDDLPSVVDAADELVATMLTRNARLLIIDPMATFIGSEKKTNGTNATSAAMFKIKKAARDANCAVILVRHMNKDAKQGKAIYRGTNSISIIGTVRAGIIAGTDPEDPERYVLATSKANLASKDDTRSIGYRIVSAPGPAGSTARVEWLGRVDYHADEIIGVTNSGKETARESAAQWIRDYLNVGEKLAAEVQADSNDAGHSFRTIKRAKDEAGAESYKRFDGKWAWRLKEEGR
jgi:hypothetical protein